MERYSYIDTKNDIASIVEETIKSGCSMKGAIARAENEYWLVGEALELPKPTSFKCKLLAAISIGSIKGDNLIENGSNVTAVGDLLKLIGPQNTISLELKDAAFLGQDASQILSSSLYDSLMNLVKSA